MMVCFLLPPNNPAQAQEDLTVSANFNTQALLTPDTAIELLLNRQLKANEGRVAVLIDRSDVTSLFIIDGTRLVYSPTLVPLPLGESQVIIYLAGPDNSWRELGRFQLHVVKDKVLPTEALTRTPSFAAPLLNTNGTAPIEDADRSTANGKTSSKSESGKPAAAVSPGQADGSVAKPSQDSSKPGKFGFDKWASVPSLALAIKSQPAQIDFPASSRPKERATFTDGTLQFSMRNEMARGWFGAQTSFDFAGSTFQPEALRFATLGNKAPQIDLSSYLVQFKLGRAKVAIGHTSFGSSRHLVNSFSSRGITVTVPITKRFDFSVAALNGTSVVGYGNFFGLAKSKHQLQSATIGVELIPKRPGGLRLEFSGVNAYIQALNSVSQGSVNDVERSKGGSVRLIATDKAGRFKFDGGFTRSQYRNPADPLLYQGTNTVPVPLLTRNARYFDISYDILRGVHLTKSKQLNLSVAAKHEQVDPLFKSLGASAGADKLENDFQLTGSIGEISFQAGHSRFNDNLRHIASILQSLTRSEQFSIALPAAALWGGTSSTSKYLPRLSYSRSDTHQFGAAIPVNGGFETNPGAVPNQYSTNHTFSAEWQFQKITLGYSYNRSFTNNQPRGHERSDFVNQTMGTRVGFNPTKKLNLSFDFTRDSANDVEHTKLAHTWRVGPTASWTVNKHLTWTAGLSNTIAGDRTKTNGSRDTEFETQCSYNVGIDRGELKKVQTQMFIRYADRYARSHDSVLATSALTRVKIFNAGLNITFF
ncbi:MAG TPA: hypothetical protein VGC60_13915 [Pyrinomonadaceae bacterium]